MRRTRSLVVFAVSMATFLAGSPAAQASDGSGGAGGGLQCGDTITTSTQLTHDLNCSDADTPALQIAGEGVVLDLGGHTVRYTGPQGGRPWPDGILVLADSTVRNGTIQGFRAGLVLGEWYSYPRRVGLSQLTLSDNRTAINHHSGHTTVTITDSRLLRNGAGLGEQQDAASGTIEVSSTLFAYNGLALSANYHTVNVVGSTFSHNGLVISCPDGSITFTSSRIVNNSVVGWLPIGAFGYGACWATFVDTVIARNTSFSHSDSDWEPLRFVLRGSWVFANGSGLLVRTHQADVQGNTWWDNEGGLSLSDPPEWWRTELTGTIRGNRFLYNRDDGLRVLVPSTLTVSDNVALGNTGWGLYVPGVIDGGGNVARGNGAGDCVGVVCAPY